ncbi:class I SAM-dependent methyltransferase [Motiliproteus sediminis]|uniref:class I SAM-dependent methyltransferase n=1 Tax=Motiliproteus sediminis TaxID=1468178 RepID=UPI001AEFE2CF|nr:class I SAM-dependent methyltransferase [Motiliproteus sediminis]
MDVASHYQHQLDPDRLLAAVDRQLGSALRPEQLAPVDQLHLGGRRASLALLEGLSLQLDLPVLDLGSGLGGTARLLAQQCSCPVVGIDLTAQFCQLAARLGERLANLLPVNFVQGDALNLPFVNASFGLAVSQHCLMNLPDLPRALAELRRVLHPQGAIVLHELLAGPGGEPYFPTPWASRADQSHLLDEQQFRGLISDAGLEVKVWRDLSADALAWRSRHARREADGVSGLSPQLVYGDRFTTLATNLQRSLRDSRVRVIHAELAPVRD